MAVDERQVIAIEKIADRLDELGELARTVAAELAAINAELSAIYNAVSSRR